MAKLSKRPIRRNSVVSCIWNPAYSGRVIRTLTDGSVLWITTTMRFMIHWPEALYHEVKVRSKLSLRNFKRKAVMFHGMKAYNTPLDYQGIFDGRTQFTREETLRYKELTFNNGELND